MQADTTRYGTHASSTRQYWIGRSQNNDPYLNGRVDDFRIYNKALAAAEIAALAQ
ncbi:LamG-like jellyroll fold domain-containing protein [Paenibacillus harenae]|uniref:LamG-like jellyroll fold domain-containing protein n=1 Tax=Paenibacillus harenae TaxID=306543 RepID=UPI00278D7645|nr:LamG-like jellyroll fold domain-containing protein [Paenibacillus harenae]MDQ0063041.1 hypothetical protein [Paenibacillus harenae]